MSRVLFRVIVALVAVFLAQHAAAQGVQTGAISGVVRDVSGAVIAQASIHAESPALQGSRVTMTDPAGAYVLRGLPIGDYSIRIEFAGFETVSSTLRVAVGEVERRLLDGDEIGNQQIGRRVNALKAVQLSAGPTLTPLPTPAYPTATPDPFQDADAELVRIINQERALLGLPPFQAHGALTTIARQHNYAMDACAEPKFD